MRRRRRACDSSRRQEPALAPPPCRRRSSAGHGLGSQSSARSITSRPMPQPSSARDHRSMLYDVHESLSRGAAAGDRGRKRTRSLSPERPSGRNPSPEWRPQPWATMKAQRSANATLTASAASYSGGAVAGGTAQHAPGSSNAPRFKRIQRDERHEHLFNTPGCSPLGTGLSPPGVAKRMRTSAAASSSSDAKPSVLGAAGCSSTTLAGDAASAGDSSSAEEEGEIR